MTILTPKLYIYTQTMVNVWLHASWVTCYVPTNLITVYYRCLLNFHCVPRKLNQWRFRRTKFGSSLCMIIVLLFLCTWFSLLMCLSVHLSLKLIDKRNFRVFFMYIYFPSSFSCLICIKPPKKLKNVRICNCLCSKC